MPPPAEVTTPRLIEKATNSTAQEVDPRILKVIKSAARFSDEEILASVDALMDQMKKPHSQVRYLAVLIVDELFMRSKLFRSQFVVNLDQFLSLSVGFKKKLPLPPPPIIATNLRSKSIELLEKWNASFGIHYKQLRLGFDYLKDTLRYQFPNRLENEARLQQERRERQAKTMQILLNKFEHLKENFSSIKSDIRSTIDEIEECLEIANVKEGNPLEFSGDADEVEVLKSFSLRQIRLESLKEGGKLQENSENKAIFDALRESYKLLISKHLPSVHEWLSVLVRVDATDNKFRDGALKELIDFRNLIHSLEKKCKEFGITLDLNFTQKEDEDLWEEGKVEAYKPADNTSASSSALENFVTEPAAKEENDTVPAAENKYFAGNIKSPTTDRDKLLAEAPVLAWAPFLLNNWGAHRDALANQRGLEVEGHWGRVDPDAVIPAEKIAELSVHCTVYKEQAVEIPPCLAPLKKGGLCQRKDLRVCPFHGPIIPRDNEGKPIDKGSHAGVGDSQPSEEVNELKRKRLELTYLKTEQANFYGSYLPGNEVAEQLVKQATQNVRERDRNEKALKRAKLAKVRKHNEEVLRDAAIASTSYSELLAEHTGEALLHDSGAVEKAKKTTLASMLKKKVTAKDRIAERLLNSRATNTSSRQLTLGEDSKYREAFPNQW